MKIELSKIVTDDSTYPRNGVNAFNVQRLVDAMDAGATLPPMVIEAGTNRLVDGWHRHEAYRRKEVATVEVIEKSYASEVDLFADAVRLNIGHGQPLDQYSIRNAIIRLTEHGYQREQISEVIRLPVAQIEKMERGFAKAAEDGRPLALKGGLSHLHGKPLTEKQQMVNRKYSGGKAVFFVRQLCELFEKDMWPDQSQSFADGMDHLVELWTEARSEKEDVA